MENDRRERRRVGMAVGLLSVCVLLLYAAAIALGDLNQDEGWYLYAGRLVHDGKHPFLDFASTQGPVMAYVYGLAYPLVAAYGVVGGRLFTAFCGIATLLLAALLAARMAATAGGDRRCTALAALLATGLLGLNLYHVYFTSLVKTYGLAGLLAVLGFLGLERALRAADRRTAGAFGFGAVAAACFALAAGTRLSAGVLLPGVWLPLAVVWLRGGACRSGLRPVLAGMLAGGTAVLAVVFLPFLLTAPAAVAFGLLDYHSGRQVGSVPVLLAYKAGFLLRLSASYFPLLALGTVGLAGRWVTAGKGAAASVRYSLPSVMGCGVAGVTAVHLAAPFPYDDYQVFVMPCVALLAAVPAASLLARLQLTPGRRSALVAGLLVLMLVHSASSPLLQSWVTARRDRIWWPLRTQTSLQGLHRAAAAVREASGGVSDDVLLTQDTYLAVETGLRVPEGMELGPFCFFPGLDDSGASRYRVLNEARLIALLESAPAEVAAFSGYGMAIRAPGITPVDADMTRRLDRALLSRYAPVAQMENFGQGETTLRIYKRRTFP
jgi:hypothetical protein